MRSQQIVTILIEDEGRGECESIKDYASRIDQAITQEVNARQNLPAWQNWDLLSVAPGWPVPGFLVFVTTWEYDPELHDDVKTDDTEESIAEDDCAVPPRPVYPAWASRILDEAFGPMNHNSLGYIGEDPYKGEVNFGDVVSVNGVFFKLTSFNQDKDDASVYFDDLKKLEENAQPEVKFHTGQTRMPRVERFGGRVKYGH